MNAGHPLVIRLIRLLAAGVAACGAVICYSGLSLLLQSNKPFQDNLHSIKGTIQEVDLTVAQLRGQSEAFNKYLASVELSLADAHVNLEQIDNQTTKLFELAGTSSVKLLNESAATTQKASDGIRHTSNQAGSIPFDPFSAQRATGYSIGDNLSVISSDLAKLAAEISKQVTEFKKTSANGLASAKQLVKTTEPQIKLLRTGAFERMPSILDALSKQLATHVVLIDSSHGLLMTMSLPIIAVGIAFMFVGAWGLLMRRPMTIASIPFNRSDSEL